MTTRPAAKHFAYDSPAEAVQAMAAKLSPVGAEAAALSQACGRVLAEPLHADRPSPACDVSAMDGYAVRVADLSARTLPVAAEAGAGRPPVSLPPGGAVRIVTGAPVPPEADAVIPREQLPEHTDRDSIELPADLEVRRGQHIRRRGENATEGQQVVPRGSLLHPAVCAAAATFGYTTLPVVRRVRATAIVTGTEVLSPHSDVAPWQLRDSNGPALTALLAPMAWTNWQGVRRVSDDPESLARAIGDALDHSDALLLTGGVSMGDYDFVPGVLEELGCRIVFHGLPIRPGKPVLGAVGPNGQAVVGLPGNPVSVMVTARLIAAPLLRHLAGLAESDPPASNVSLIDADDKRLPLHWSRPVRLTAHGRASLVATRGSGDVAATAWSDGFVQLPPDGAGAGPWPFYRWSIEP